MNAKKNAIKVYIAVTVGNELTGVTITIIKFDVNTWKKKKEEKNNMNTDVFL